MDINVIVRGRGRVLLYNGHEFYFHVKYKNSTNLFWRCRGYKSSGCTGTVTMCEDLSVVLKEHVHSNNCLPNENRNAMSVLINSSIEEAGSSVEETVPSIYKNTVNKVKNKGLDLVEEMPSYGKFSSVAYRRRNKKNKTNKMAFKEANDVVITQNDNFLLADFNHYYKHGSSDVGRILIFASEEARQIISNGKIFLCDGTFKKCPKPFKQLYVIFCDIGSTEDTNNLMPVAYAFLSNKSKNTYIKMLQLIKAQIPDWNPAKFITDFEQSAISAIKYVFPKIQQHGCFYHFQNKLFRKAKALALKNRYCRKIVALCTVLPLLPLDAINEGWNYIVQESETLGQHNCVQLFLTYMKKFWIPKKRLWCCFGERHRTTNVCEGWNAQYNCSFKRRPTTLSHCLSVLKRDATFNAANKSANKRKKSVRERDSYILDVQMQLINGLITVPLFLEKLRV